MRSYKSDLGVTEVVGILMLLMISISIFSVLNFYVLTFDSPDHPISANIIGYIDGHDLILEHRGGSYLKLNQTSIMLNVNNTKNELDPMVDFTLSNQNTNGDQYLWEISEILIYTHAFNLNNSNVDVNVIDLEYNSIVMTGTLNKEDEINNIPSIPSLPVGPESGETGISYSYSTSSNDPDGDVIKYGWDWDGDNSVDEWTSFYASGSPVSTSHSWGSANTYNVKVKAMDVNNGQSDFSTSLTVVISGVSNNPPDAPTNPTPSNSATGIGTSPSLIVDISDPDSDTMDVTFYNASDDSVIGTDLGRASGGTATTTWSGLSYSTVYSWYAIADDGTDTTQSSTWSFTTESGASNNPPDAPANPTPSDSATGIGTSPSLIVDISDPDSDTMDVTFYNASDDSVIGADSGVTSGGTATTTWSGLSYSTVYSWYAIADDGTDTTQSSTWSFTTESAPLWTLLTYDDFESGSLFSSSNYTDGGGDCSIYTGGTKAHQGNNAAGIQDNTGDASSFYHTNGIDVDTPGYSSIKVDFWFITDGFSGVHDFFVEYWDGSTWRKPATLVYNTDFSNDQFYHKIVWINETDYTFPSDMKIKFRCDSGNNNNDVYIDEIYVYAK